MEVTAEQARQQHEISEEVYCSKMKAAEEEILNQARAGRTEAYIETYNQELERYVQQVRELRKAGFIVGDWYNHRIHVSW